MRNPPAVLFVTGEYPPDLGGIADYTTRLRAALQAHGVASAVLTRRRERLPRSRPDLAASLDGSPPGVYRLVRRWSARSLAEAARLAPAGGIVHLQYQPAAFGLRGEICLLPLWLRARRRDVHVVTTFHDARVPYLFPKAGPLRRLAVRLLARGSHAVLAADPRDLRVLGGPSPRHHLVPIGSNVERAPPAGYQRAATRATLGLGPGALAVVYFGFLNASKGLAMLLAAFRLVLERRPNARLLVLGGAASGSDRTDWDTGQRFRDALGPLAAHVVRSEYLPPPALSAHLLAADVALLPYADGASMRRGSLLACAVHGLPIVSTRGSGLTSELAASLIACPPGNARSLSDAVLQVAADPALAARLRVGSEALARRVGWEAIAARHLRLYRSLR